MCHTPPVTLGVVDQGSEEANLKLSEGTGDPPIKPILGSSLDVRRTLTSLVLHREIVAKTRPQIPRSPMMTT